MIQISEAFELIRSTVNPLAVETIELKDAVGRVLAQDIASDVDSPPYDKSMMDGFAIRAEDINAGLKKFEVIETVAAGSWPKKVISAGTSARIMTGAPIPDRADSVVMIELSETSESGGKQYVTLNIDRLEAGKYTMPRANNIAKGQTVFGSGHQIRTTDIALLAETGAARFDVRQRPTIAVLPTGDEIVDCSKVPGKAQIRNSNGPMLVAMANQIGLETTDLGIGPDDEARLAELVQNGLKNNILLLSGGVSMGEFDLVPKILSEAGVKQVFHKVAIKPGKPIWFGVLDRENGESTYVFGLPGNPVSSMIGFHLFVRSAVRLLTGEENFEPQAVMAILNSNHHARGNRPTYWPSCWVRDEDSQRKVEPLQWHGSSDLVALGKAEALAYFPAGTKEHLAGEVLKVYSLS